MAIVLFDNAARKKLAPLTFSRAVADIRLGIFTAKERWQKITNAEVYVFTENYLQSLYAPVPAGTHTWIDAALILNEELIDRIITLEDDISLADENGLIAFKKNIDASSFIAAGAFQLFDKILQIENVKRLEYPWQIFKWNDKMIATDFALAIKGKSSANISTTNHLTKTENIFIEEGALVEHAYLNGSAGPVYIGKNATIMEGALIRGPFAACENALIKMGAKIYGATTVGPHCIAGGEIKNVVLQGFSNKAHDGYLGDAVIGYWCNIGAGTSNSNIKNNAGNIFIFHNDDKINIGTKCGCIMGDYSRTAINTSINTGTIIGTCCNIFGEGLTQKTIPNFQWGNKVVTSYELNKAIQDIANWKKLKHYELTNAEIDVLKYIFEQNI